MKYNEIPAYKSGIYRINFPNGKIYIGRAKNIKVRIWEHFKKIDNTPCQFALFKYYSSYKDIEIDILEEVSPYNHDLICQLEKKWIAKFQANEREIGYNIAPGGEGGGVGINNPASKIDEEDLKNIIFLLRQQKTNAYIGNLYGLHPDTIGRINNGKSYFNQDLNYPIRIGKGKTEYKEKYNSFTNEQLDEVLYLLDTTELSRQQISSQTGMSTTTITNLNTGKHPYCKLTNLSFPIRKTRRTVFLTEEEVLLIKEELLNPNYSIQDIANHFSCSRDTIGDINQGKRYSSNKEVYPIRKFYPKRGSKKSVSTISGTGE